MLTPKEIHTKEFNKKMRGYDVDEVNRFLDEIVRDFESLIKERQALDQDLQEANKRLAQYENIEETLNKSIIVAQQTADQLKETSEKEAQLIVEEAQDSADRLLREAVDRANVVAEETEELRRQSTVFRQRLQLMLESQIDLVQNEEWDKLLEAADPNNGSYEEIQALNQEFDLVEYEPSDFQPVFQSEDPEQSNQEA